MMDVHLYRAAMEGQVDILLENRDKLEDQLTPTKNTLLHIAALFGKTECVITILTYCPSLVLSINNKGETPLHIAAKGGQFEVARALIISQGRKTLLRKTNEDGDTALHVAVRQSSRRFDLEFVKLLIEQDPGFTHPPNKTEETPLYLAAEKGLDYCISEILKSSQAPSPYGPSGRTALHAAAIFDSMGSMRELLKWKQGYLSREVDKYGWMPLHYAAQHGHLQSVRQLIELDASLAYVPAGDVGKDNNITTTVLHIAASRGCVDIMELLISHCPDCFEMLNSRGENILHIAVKNQKVEVIELILKDPFLESLISQKDNDGNTPLHTLAACQDSNSFGRELLTHPRAEMTMMTFNNENETPLDVYHRQAIQDGNSGSKLKSIGEAFERIGYKGRQNAVSNDNVEIETKKKRSVKVLRKGAKEFKSNDEINLLVATLIATVTFAAGFTLPGGYDSNVGSKQGMAVLARNAAFQAFIVTDTIAMMFSSTAVFTYFVASVTQVPNEYEEQAPDLVNIARTAMVVAFITGIYATLQHAVALAISVCIIGCIAPLIYTSKFFDLVE